MIGNTDMTKENGASGLKMGSISPIFACTEFDPFAATDKDIVRRAHILASLPEIQCVQEIQNLLHTQCEMAQANITDHLTGLLNRDGFMKKLCAKIDGIRRREGGQEKRGVQEEDSAVIFIDLDGFKAVNDFCGHEAGDRALQEVAQRLQNSFRTGDVIARIGGDELALVIEPFAPDESFNDATLKSRIHKALDDLIFWHDGRPYPVCASLGVVLFNAQSVERMGDGPADEIAALLLSDADTRMYEDKSNGKVERLDLARVNALQSSQISMFSEDERNFLYSVA